MKKKSPEYSMPPIILTAKSSREFERYQRRKATKKEIAYFKKAEEFYLLTCKSKQGKK